MREGKTVGILLSLVLLYAAPIALEGMESSGQPREVEVTGRVRLVGTSRMPSLVITTEGREWYIDHDGWEKLFDLQQQVVTVRAWENYRDMFFANGHPAGRRYILSNITVVRVGG